MVGGGNDTPWQRESLARALTYRNGSEWSPVINKRRARASFRLHTVPVGAIQEGGTWRTGGGFWRQQGGSEAGGGKVMLDI